MSFRGNMRCGLCALYTVVNVDHKGGTSVHGTYHKCAAVLSVTDNTVGAARLVRRRIVALEVRELSGAPVVSLVSSLAAFLA